MASVMRSLGAVLVAAQLGACGVADAPSEPAPPVPAGAIAITVTTVGPDPDPWGYTVSLAGSSATPLERFSHLTDTLVMTGVVPGDLILSIRRVPSNCVVDGGASRTIRVTAGETTRVALAVSCARMEGVLAVSSATFPTELAFIARDGTVESIAAAADSPNWSPSGDRLAFVRYLCWQEYGGLCTRVGDGLFVRPLRGPEQRLTSDPRDRSPVWDPDGVSITYARGSEIRRIRADGSDDHQVVDLPVSDVGDFQWAPNGGRLVFTCATTIPGSQTIAALRSICSIEADGAGFEYLVFDNYQNRGPVWHPDGRQLVYATDRFGTGVTLAVLNPATLGISRFGDGLAVAWSRDGTQRATIHGTSMTLTREGTGDEIVTVSGTFLTPAWRP